MSFFGQPRLTASDNSFETDKLSKMLGTQSSWIDVVVSKTSLESQVHDSVLLPLLSWLDRFSNLQKTLGEGGDVFHGVVH